MPSRSRTNRWTFSFSFAGTVDVWGTSWSLVMIAAMEFPSVRSVREAS